VIRAGIVVDLMIESLPAGRSPAIRDEPRFPPQGLA
jgi:hypothetical protein